MLFNSSKPQLRRIIAVELFFSAALLAQTQSSAAIVISDDLFLKNGGDLNDVAGTIGTAMVPPRRQSMAPQFSAVGQLGYYCTATWLGDSPDGKTSYVLTAYHCVDGDKESEPFAGNFNTDNLTVDEATGAEIWTEDIKNAAGDGTKYILPDQLSRPGYDARTDLAIVALPKLRDLRMPDGTLVAKPRIYIGDNEVGKPVTLLGYGSWGTGSTGSNGGFRPTEGPRRSMGESILGLKNDVQVISGFDKSDGLDTGRWGVTAPGDSGSAWWQNQGGVWSIVGVLYGGSPALSTGPRMHSYWKWIRSIYPDVLLYDYRDTARSEGETHVFDNLLLQAAHKGALGTGEVKVDSKGELWTVVDDALNGHSLINNGLVIVKGDSHQSVSAFAGKGTLALEGTSHLDVNTLAVAKEVYEGVIQGTGSLTKMGDGSLTLEGDNSYAGVTKVSAGNLFVNGDQSAATGRTIVGTNAFLGGDGSLGGDVEIKDGAILAPGSQAKQPGTLEIGGDLTLNENSILRYQFGEADVEGGPLNDLIRVAEDLVLDGRIDVSVSKGGSFDPGVYRILSYGGRLSDNLLALGAMPGSDSSLQTAIDGQVNLINMDNLVFSFWDGNGSAANGQPDGGDGIWRAGDGDTSWTDESGGVNSSFTNGSFAVFSNKGGTVKVDGSEEAVSASAIQFTADGYRLEGDAVTLSDTSGTAIWVGAGGSSEGADYRANIASELRGNTSLIKKDLGTLVLSADNSYSGGTRIEGGTVEISRDANLGDAEGAVMLAGGTLRNMESFKTDRNFEVDAAGGTIQSDPDLELKGSITGSGTLTKTGGGTLILSGQSDDFMGRSLIKDGVLAVNGSIAQSRVELAHAVILTGAGTIGGLVNAGTVSPGKATGDASYDVLEVKGDVSFLPKSTFRVEADAEGRSDRIEADGKADIKGGSVAVSPMDGDYRPETTYTILRAANGVSGTFDEVKSELAFLTPQLSYLPEEIILALTRNGTRFIDSGTTPNQRSVGAAVEALGTEHPIYAAIVGGTEDEARDAFGLLSGDLHAGTRSVMAGDAGQLRSIMLDRARISRSHDQAASDELANTILSYAPGSEGIGQGTRNEAILSDSGGAQLTSWMRGLGSWSEFASGDHGAAKLKASSEGFVAGTDATFDDLWRIGIAGGYHGSSVESARHASASIGTYSAGIYGSRYFGKVSFGVGASYSLHDILSTRWVAARSYEDTLSADYDARTGQAFGELGYDFALGPVTLQPFAAFSYANVTAEDFTEDGRAARLTVKKGSEGTSFSTLGLRLSAEKGLNEATSLIIGGTLGWQHAIDGRTPTSKVAFSDGGSFFQVGGVPIAADNMLVEANVGVQFQDQLTLGLSYSGEVASPTQMHSLKGSFLVSF